MIIFELLSGLLPESTRGSYRGDFQRNYWGGGPVRDPLAVLLPEGLLLKENFCELFRGLLQEFLARAPGTALELATAGDH